MRSPSALWAVVLVTLGVVQHSLAEAPARQVLLNLDQPVDLAAMKPGLCQAAPVSSDGKPALRITTPAMAFWPGVNLPAPAGKWDLSAFEYVSLDIRNVDKHDIDVFVRVDNPNSNGQQNCVVERTAVAPDQRVTLTVPIKRVSNSPIKLFGMIGYPQGLYVEKTGLDPANIVGLVVFTANNTPLSNTFEVSNIYAGGKYQDPKWMAMTPQQFFPFIDKFGQFVHKDWPGKIHSEAELQQARETEAAALAADPGPAQWSKWGGWAAGPKLEATGHFRVAKHEGKWTLVDPDGYLFFSTGITGVNLGWAGTPIDGRADWFVDLPPNDAANKAFYGKSYKLWSGHYKGAEPVMFDHSRLNLRRKYGENWQSDYRDLVHRRLRAWGINTIANWSDGALQKMHRTPYTPTFYYSAPKLNQRGSGFPDVFDPKFAAGVLAGARQWMADSASDPWCIGYFVDNEMPWGGDTTLALDALKLPGERAAKAEIVRWLKERYPDIAALNAAWGTSFADWDAFARETKFTLKTDASTRDLTAFTERIAETYFKTIRDAIKTVGPHKLYLGCRSVGGSENVIALAIKYCDVVSYNRYCHTVRELRFPGKLDGPMIIGEFHFGASDRGLFWNGLVSCDNQEDRALKYREYVQSALDNPLIVGTHWFQYGDEAVTGRGDGENAQCGFVDVCDTPYKETVQASRLTADGMYQRRFGKPAK